MPGGVAGAREVVPARLRRDRMRRVVAERDFVRVAELSAMFGISEVTVRSDLDQLASRGQVRRVRGGAMPRPMPGSERPFEGVRTAHAKEKAAIGRHAATLVHAGDRVILDVGTTCTAVARALAEREELVDVTVFTSGLDIALALASACPRFTVVVTGGTLRPPQHSLVDPMAGLILERINADTVFLGCNGIDLEHGVTNRNLPEAAVKQRMLRAARRGVVVADASKLGTVELAHLCDLDDVHALITAGQADQQLLADLAGSGLDVQVAR